jgi:hypothetical protein
MTHSSKSSTKKRALSNSSRCSSNTGKLKQQKKKTAKVAKAATAQISYDQSVKRRHAKILAMEEDYLQSQIASTSTPVMQLNELSAISTNTTHPNYYDPQHRQMLPR